jgi:hypothetical protein
MVPCSLRQVTSDRYGLSPTSGVELILPLDRGRIGGNRSLTRLQWPIVQSLHGGNAQVHIAQQDELGKQQRQAPHESLDYAHVDFLAEADMAPSNRV